MKRHYPTYVQSIGLILLMIPIGVVPILFLAAFHVIESTLAIVGVYSVIMSLTIVAGLNFRRNFTFSWGTFPVSVLIIAFAFMISFHLILEPLTSKIPPPEGLQRAFSELIQMPMLAFIMIVVLAPLLEELLFRGIILDGYLKNYSPVNSILISAFLFALIHGNIAQGIGAFLMGVVAGVFYWRTKSLLFCIALHFSNNFTGYVAMMMDPEGLSSEGTLRQSINNDLIYFAIYLTLCLIFTASGWYLWVNYVNPVREMFTRKPVVSPETASTDQVE
jgi:uncharacterized protein